MKPFVAYLLALVMLVSVGVLLAPVPFALARSSASVWFVATSGSDSSSCQSPAAPCVTINGAIGKASSGDTIYVAAGTYTGTGTEVVLLNKDITLYGGWDSTFTTQNGMSTVDGQKVRRGITVSSGVTAIAERLIVRNGFADWGGGVSVNAGTLTLNDSSVLGNTASMEGGGVFQYTGVVTVNHTMIVRNAVTFSSGGGIRSFNGSLTLINSIVLSNTAANGGGGGISQNGGNVYVNNSTIGSNVTKNSGGGIDVYAGTLTLKNATVSGNSAIGSVLSVGSGGGVYKHDGTVLLQNSIIAKNNAKSSPDCSGAPISLGYNLIGNSYGCNFGSNTGDLVDVDARLVPVASIFGFYPLYSDSPAVDAGNPSGCTDHLGNPITTDQRGVPRVGRCDMGAYEYTAPGPAATIFSIDGTPQHTRPATAFLSPLKAAVLDSMGNPVSGVTVTFTAPSTGASAAFTNTGTFTASILTDGGGIAGTSLLANETWGSYAVTATAKGVVTPANFLLGNIVWYIAQDGSDANSCQTPANACAAINEPFDRVDYLADDIVFVAAGIYTDTGAEVVLINKGVTLSGGWNRTFTDQNGSAVVDGQGARRGITVNSGVMAAVDRFVFRNGYVNSRNGGGVFNAGVLTFTRGTVFSNTAIGFVFSTGSQGGGIYNDGGILNLIGTTVNANVAEGCGGGIRNTGFLAVTNGTVSNNTGWCAGGISNDGVAQINNSTITRNTYTSSPAGGISNSYPDGVTIRNSILAGNIIDCQDQIKSAGYNIIGTLAGCTYFKSSTGDLTNVDPGVFDLMGVPAYYPLLPNSPAIDAGNPAGCADHEGNLLPADQRGTLRPIDGNGDGSARCDIGAYELDPNNNPIKQVFLPIVLRK